MYLCLCVCVFVTEKTTSTMAKTKSTTWTQDIGTRMPKASDWPVKRNRWYMNDIEWLVHKECKRLDRARWAHNTFWCTTHETLTNMVSCEMFSNNHVSWAGSMVQGWVHIHGGAEGGLTPRSKDTNYPHPPPPPPKGPPANS